MNWSDDDAYEAEVESLVNLTPLIDILLVVLLTLMISVGFSTFQTNVNLPEGAALEQAQSQVGDGLEIFSDGTVKLNQQLIDLDKFVKTSQQISLNIYCDRSIAYEVLMRVLTTAQKAGYRTFQFHYQEG
jgi:biopolymer transport protein ExbD